MKFYGLAGCVIMFLFSILQETYQQGPCSEYRIHLMPVDDDNEGGPAERVDIRRINESDLLDNACLLVGWNSESCGPIYFTGKVLLRDRNVYSIDIRTYNRAETMSWTTTITTQRISDEHHIYEMNFVAATIWSYSASGFVPFTLSPGTIDRFNTYFALLAVDDNVPIAQQNNSSRRSRRHVPLTDFNNYGMKICQKQNSQGNQNFFSEAGCLLKKNSASEDSYDTFKTQMAGRFDHLRRNPFLNIITEVPVRDEVYV